jgi:glycosyltransferase involved in cell wall biosynthesis
VNGSTDNSADAARAAGAEVLHAAPGVPHALAVGLAAARRAGAPWVVQMDGDGQHPAAALPALLAALDGGADLVVGSRFLEDEPGYPVPVSRRLAIEALSRAASRWSGQRLTDVTSGLRAWSPRAIATLLPDLPTDLVDGNLLVRAIRRGLVVREVPTPMRARAGGASMHLGWHGPAHAARMAARMLEEILP